MKGAKGSGLDMSIVHALVVERYRGRVSVRNMVKEDHTQGTLVELLLPSA